jgi:arginyl-tRNA synthetase
MLGVPAPVTSLSDQLRDALAHAIAAAYPQAADADPLIRPSDHADLQVNAALGLAKRVGAPPRQVAEGLVDALEGGAVVSRSEISGPGFINLTIADEALWDQVRARLADDRLGVAAVEHGTRTVVDYSAPNIAKEMHVGHIRSTVLGDALSRVLAFVGHKVTRDNHLGDWGTQFGMLIVGMRRHGSQAALAEHPVQELERVYKLTSAEAKENPAVADEARAELAKLQKGDPENRRLWESFVKATRVELDAIYERLGGVQFDLWMGESAYEEMLPGVVARLLKEGIARVDQDAVCVFFEGDPELGKSETPFIIQKKDGAFLYGTTDIATVLWRQDHLGTERALYVVGKPQALHFKQLFATVRKLGVTMQLEHIGFGSILGSDGKLLRTRGGATVRLADLLDEAEERAAALMKEEGIELEPALVRSIAVGAVKYADLCQNRTSDYRFDWGKLISLKGNSGPYLQYANARVRAIFRKGEVDPSAELGDGGALDLAHEAELLLSKRLLAFADVVHVVAETSQPHLLCEHLFSLARDFSGFYEQCPVLKAEGPARRTRLLLCWLTTRQLARGLDLLGIAAPERM